VRGYPTQILRFNSPFFRDWLFWFVVVGFAAHVVAILHVNALYDPYPDLVGMCWFIPWLVVGALRAGKRITRL
jgi:hypothetical protein